MRDLVAKGLDQHFKSVAENRIVVEAVKGRTWTLRRWTWRERQQFYIPWTLNGKIPPGSAVPTKAEDLIDFENELIFRSLEHGPERKPITKSDIESLENWVEAEALYLAACRLNLNFLSVEKLSGALFEASKQVAQPT